MICKQCTWALHWTDMGTQWLMTYRMLELVRSQVRRAGGVMAQEAAYVGFAYPGAGQALRIASQACLLAIMQATVKKLKHEQRLRVGSRITHRQQVATEAECPAPCIIVVRCLGLGMSLAVHGLLLGGQQHCRQPAYAPRFSSMAPRNSRH